MTNTTAMQEGKKRFDSFLKDLPRRYRDGNLVFAHYAAHLPFFDVDMLRMLWQNINAYKQYGEVVNSPYVVVSDILQASFCEKVGYKLFEFHPDVATYLKELKATDFEERTIELLFDKRHVAAFMWKYGERFYTHPRKKNLKDLLYWKGLAILDPNEAGRRIAERLNTYDKNDFGEDAPVLLNHLEEIATDLEKADELKLDYQKVGAIGSVANERTLWRNVIKEKRWVSIRNKQEKIIEEGYKSIIRNAEFALSLIEKEKKELTGILELENCNLHRLPDELFECNWLKVLNLSSNQISKLEGLDNLTALQQINFSSNQISKLEGLDNLTALQQINFSFNQISKLEGLDNLTALQQIDFSFNQISKLEGLDNLTALQQINFSSNQIISLAALESLTQLKNLLLSNNQISDISYLQGLNQLHSLDLSSNRITHLTSSLPLFKTDFSVIYNAETLRGDINLANNPLQFPPLEIALQGINAIKSYFKQQAKKPNQKIYEAKVLFIGEGGAGKTSLCRKILNSQYDLQTEFRDNHTEGVDISSYTFPFKEGQDFHLKLWDFGGQEIYHSTNQFFLTERSLYLLVTDSKKDDTHLSYWLNVQQLLAKDAPVFIIENEKQDRAKSLNYNEIRERFTNVKGFYRTNLLNNRGLAEIIKAIELEVQKLPHIGIVLPEAWTAIRTLLENKEVPYISISAYFEICKAQGIDKKADAKVLSKYLHDIGVILHFQDNPILERLVILDNEWGTNAVYKVVDDEKVKRQQGKFEYSDLSNIWSDNFYRGKYAELLALMQKFKLCYRVPDTQTYIAPVRLPINRPIYVWDESDNIQLRYRYRFMPKGILTRFIVEMNQDIKETEAEGAIANQLAWKTGVVLEREGTLAQVLELYGEDEIRVSIKGASAGRLRSLITYQIDRINKTFHNLKVEKLIPCNCTTCSGSQNPYFFKESNLLKREAVGKKTIECQVAPHYYEVQISTLIRNFALKDKEVDYKVMKQEGIRLVGKAKLKDVFDLFEGHDTKSAFAREMSVHRAKWSHLENAKHQGILDQAYYLREISKISKSLIDLLSSDIDLGITSSDESADEEYFEEERIKISIDEIAKIEHPKITVDNPIDTGVKSLNHTRMLLVTPLKDEEEYNGRKKSPVIHTGIKSLKDIFSYAQPNISIDLDKGDAKDSVETITIRFKEIADFLPKNIITQIPFLQVLDFQEEVFESIWTAFRNENVHKLLDNQEQKNAILLILNGLLAELNGNDEYSKIYAALSKFQNRGELEILFSLFPQPLVKSLRNFSPGLVNKARRELFLHDPSHETERRNLKRGIELLLGILNGSDNGLELKIIEVEERKEKIRELKNLNLKNIFEKSRALERIYRQLDLMFANTPTGRIDHLSILEVSETTLLDVDNYVVEDAISDEFRNNYDRLSLEDAYSFLVIPEFLGSELIAKYAKIAHDSKVLFFTDYRDCDNVEDILYDLEQRNLGGAESYWSNAAIFSNYIRLRDKFEFLYEYDDLYGSPVMSIAGLVHNQKSIISQPYVGARHGAIRAKGLRISNIRVDEVSSLAEVGINPIIEEFGGQMIYGATTLFQGENYELQNYATVRVFDYINKCLRDFLNETHSMMTNKQLGAIQFNIAKFFNLLTTKRVIKSGKIIELKRDKKQPDKVGLSVHIEPLSAARAFTIQLTKEDNGNGYDYLEEMS